MFQSSEEKFITKGKYKQRDNKTVIIKYGNNPFNGISCCCN